MCSISQVSINVSIRLFFRAKSGIGCSQDRSKVGNPNHSGEER